MRWLWLCLAREGLSLQQNPPWSKRQVEHPCRRAKPRRGKKFAWGRLQVEQSRRILEKRSSCGVLVHICDPISRSRTQRLRERKWDITAYGRGRHTAGVNRVIHRLTATRPPNMSVSVRPLPEGREVRRFTCDSTELNDGVRDRRPRHHNSVDRATTGCQRAQTLEQFKERI